MKKPQNVDELKDQLLDATEWVKADPRRANQLKVMNNTVRVIIALTNLQVRYARLRGEQPDVPFMRKASGIPLKPKRK